MIPHLFRKLKELAAWILDRLKLRNEARRILAKVTGRPYVELDAPPREIFETIYRTNYWGSEVSRSGTGSTLTRTNRLREAIRELIKAHGISTILDAACGDFTWMREMNFESMNVRYTGLDIVPPLIDDNNAKYGNSVVRFQCLNLISDNLPAADLVICRDCLVHLSEEHVLAALRNIANSGSRYLLTTSFRHTTRNKSIQTGDWRALNLMLPPFSVGTPLVEIVEEDAEDGFGDSKTLILLDLARLRAEFATRAA
jgi:hypothetical protein